MGLFDRKPEKKKVSAMTLSQKNRQKHAIWDYYKKKNSSDSHNSNTKNKNMK